MRTVGLNIEKGLVSVAIVLKALRQTELKESYSLPFSTDAELVEILKEKSKDWAGAKIVSSMPGNFFSQRLALFPFSDSKRVEKALPFELEDSVPFSLDDVVLDHLVLAAKGEKEKETPVLGLMLPKTLLRRHIELLASAGIDPHAIVPSFIGLSTVSRMIKSEGVALIIAGNDVCMKSNNSVKACRSVSNAGFKHLVQALETEHKEKIEKAYLLRPNDAVSAEFVELGIPLESITPEIGGKIPAEAVSLGLALTDLVNFRKGEFAFRLADVGIRSRRRTLYAAGAATALIIMLNIGVKFYVVQTGYGRLDKEIKDLYRQTFPDAKLVADPVRQLKDKLEESRKKFGVLGSGISALDVIKAVTDGIPKEVRVAFQEFNLEGDRLKLQGEASSFESVDKIKAELLKAEPFAEVNVQDTRMGVENKVKFRMELKLKQAL